MRNIQIPCVKINLIHAVAKNKVVYEIVEKMI